MCHCLTLGLELLRFVTHYRSYKWLRSLSNHSYKRILNIRQTYQHKQTLGLELLWLGKSLYLLG